jgi:hypothetical protein
MAAGVTSLGFIAASLPADSPIRGADDPRGGQALVSRSTVSSAAEWPAKPSAWWSTRSIRSGSRPGHVPR